jgi:protein-serine/threonine kinase
MYRPLSTYTNHINRQDLEYWRTQDDEWISSPTQYIKTKSLGRGTFSKVILATPLENPAPSIDPSSKLLAIKVVNLDATEDAPASRISSSARRELEILKKINHPCITRLLAYKEVPEKCLFGLQYSRGGDLFDFASRQRPLLTPVFVKAVFRELVLAVQYLHETMYVHRDLKLESMSPHPPPPPRLCCRWQKLMSRCIIEL